MQTTQFKFQKDMALQALSRVYEFILSWPPAQCDEQEPDDSLETDEPPLEEEDERADNDRQAVTQDEDTEAEPLDCEPVVKV